ncbi:hypothetical protein [Methylobacterium sp. ID0610]|uniref:hypothetical protein n=1 Tax=Methylobacterium carpenticola TaxID=3344827 RepID=UPI0036C0CA34
MKRGCVRLGAEALGVGMLWLGVLMVAGGDGAAALGLRPGLDPTIHPSGDLVDRAPVRVVLQAPWTHATAAFAEEARQAGLHQAGLHQAGLHQAGLHLAISDSR